LSSCRLSASSSKVRISTTHRKNLHRGFFGLVVLVMALATFGGAQAAHAANGVSIVSPTSTQLAPLAQRPDGTWVAEITMSATGSSDYLASWEKRGGVWATPVEAAAAIEDLNKCKQSVVQAYFGKYATRADLYTHFQFNPDGSWQSAEIDKLLATTCDATSPWSDVESLGHVDGAGRWVVDVPLSKLPPGSHQVFLMSVSTAGSNTYDACSKTWPDGSWTGYDCWAIYSQPVYYTINVPVPSTSNRPLPGIAVAEGSFFEQSVFSDLEPVNWEELPEDIARAAGVAVILTILMSFPTALISSAVSKSQVIWKKWRWLDAANVTIHGAWSFPIMILGAIIASFSDPTFALDLSTLRLVLTVLVSFAVMDYGATWAGWFVTRNHTGQERPQLSAKPLFLLVIAATVIFARLTDVDPSVVFGSVIALDLGSRLAKNTEAISTLASTAYTLVVGVVSWFTYSAVADFDATEFAPANLNTDSLIEVQGWLSLGQVTFGELLAIFTVSALSTIPLSLLPFGGFGGQAIFKWRKWVWALLYGVGLTLYCLVLVPAPSSWSETSRPFVLWMTLFLIYTVVGILVYFVVGEAVKRYKEEHPEPEEVPSEA
jgi:hypothetical protein